MTPTKLTVVLGLVTALRSLTAAAEPGVIDPFGAALVRRTGGPLVEAAHLIERRVQDVRCLLPDARISGTVSTPEVEVCASPDGVLRICMQARVSLQGDLAATTGSVFLTDRPGICPGRTGF